MLDWIFGGQETGQDSNSTILDDHMQSLLEHCGLLEFDDLEECIAERRASVTDSDVVTSLLLSVMMGLGCFVTFIILRNCNAVYQTRLELGWIGMKPPVMAMKGWGRLWSWVTPLVYITSTQLIATAGIDSLILLRTHLFASQLLLLMTLVGCGILIPVHLLLGNEVRMDMLQKGFPPSIIMMSSSFNLAKGSDYYWIHFAVVMLFASYACWLLWAHYRSIVRLRQQHFLIGNGSYNPWLNEFLKLPGGGKEEEGPGIGVTIANHLSKLITPSYMDSTSPLAVSERRGSEVKARRPGAQYQRMDESYGSSSFTSAAPAPIESMIRNVGRMSMTLNEKLSQALMARRPEGSTRVPSTVVPWWSEKDAGKEFVSGKPAVPYRKLINATTEDGSSLGVNAQQYAALVRDLPPLSGYMRKIKSLFKKKQGGATGKAKDVADEFDDQGVDTRLEAVEEVSEYAEEDVEPDKSSEGSMEVSRDGEGSKPLLGVTKPFKKLSNKTKRAKQAFSLKLAQRFLPWLAESDGDSSYGVDESDMQRKLRRHKQQMTVIEQHFKRLFPTSFQQVVPVRKHKEIEYLLYVWDEVFRLLDNATQYHATTGKRPKAYPIRMARVCQATCLSWLGPGMSVCVVCEAVCPCCCARPVDAIDYYTTRKGELESQISALRQVVLEGPGTGSYFVLFNNQRDAAVAVQTQLFAEGASIFTVESAPGPDEVNWSSLWARGWLHRQCRVVLVMPFIVLFILFPIGIFTASMAELDLALCSANSKLYSEWYCFYATGVRLIITGIIPSLLLVTYENLILPLALYYLVMAQRSDTSFTNVDMKILSIYFCWNVFNVFLGGLLGGTVFAQIMLFAHNPGGVYNIIGTALASQAPFFINYICFRAFFAAPLRLVYPHMNVVMEMLYTCRIFKSQTPRQKATQIIPFNVRYGREYGVMFLTLLLSLCFSVICPIILPFGLAFSLLNYLVFKYQILYVYERSYESGGMHWPTVFKYVMFSVGIFVLMSACMLIACEAYLQGSLLLLVVMPLLHQFYRYCTLRFRARMEHVPLDIADAMPSAYVTPSMYVPPALRDGAVGWFPEIGKVWEWWWTPLYTC